MRYFFADYCLDTQRYELHQAGVPIPLPPKVFQVLAYLVAWGDRVVSKEELLEHLWPGQAVGDGALNSYIMAVRKVLGDRGDSQRLLRTVRGWGYRFVAPVEVRDPLRPTVPLSAVPPPAAEGPARQVVSSPPLVGPPPEAGPASLLAPLADGEYKSVSVLCCALADAPALAARLGPEGWYHLLQTVLGLAQEVLQPYDGTLTLPTSEGFTAVFGVPTAQEDHARRAVLAACELHQRLRQHPALRAQPPGGGLALRMGLHSGLVVIGKLGQAPQHGATAVGVPLLVAMRLQQQATPGTTLLSAVTYRLVQAEVRAAPCGTLALEGQPTPLPVYAVQGLLGQHAGVMGRGPRTGSPFVGRARELALLHDCLAAVRTGQGQVVGLVGEPGMGKTRLVREFCRSLADQAVTVVVGQCLSYGQATPYLPVRALLRQVCGLAEGDAAAAHTAAVQHRLHASGMTAEEDVALLCHLLDLPVAPECLARLSLQARQARTFALLRHLVLHAAQPQPLVLVVENLHWSDPTSTAWLTSLVERLTGAAILLVGTCRPGSPLPWGAHAAVTQVALPPLRGPDSRAVVQAVLGAVILPEARLRAMIAQAMGNPFFLEELAWHAVEHDQPNTAGTVPETVQAVLAARMDRLPLAAKRLLQIAAVIGMDVSFPLLRVIAEQPEESLQQSLAYLQAAEFLYETRLFPEPEYTFKHALTHEVAYNSLLLERRRGLHARIVEAIEALAPERATEQVERLAHHALRGEVWDKVLAYCRQAGEKALARSAHREAGGYFEQTLSALPHLPETRDTREQAIDLRLALRSALLPSGNFGHIVATLCEAETLAAALDDPRRLGQVSRFLSNHFWLIGAHDQAIAAGQRALALATDDEDTVLQALSNLYLGRAYQAQGNNLRAIDCFEQTVASLAGAQRRERFGQVFLPAVNSRAHLAWCHAELGTFAEGRALGDEGLQIAEAVDHPGSLMFACWGIGLLSLRQGDLPRARSLLERAVGICQDADLPLFFPWIAPALGAAYTLAGRVDDGVPLLTQALEQTTAMEMVGLQALCCLSLGEAQLQAGRLEEVHALAERALSLAREHQECSNQAYALRLLGDIAVHREPPETEPAEAHYRQACDLAEALGMRPLVAHCHHGLGRLYGQTGRAEQARAALTTAIDLYRAMDMTFWLPQADTARSTPLEVMHGSDSYY